MLLPLQATELGAAGQWQQDNVRTMAVATHANTTRVHLLGSALPQAASTEAHVRMGFLVHTCPVAAATIP